MADALSLAFHLIRDRLADRSARRIVDPRAARAAVALVLCPRTAADMQALLIRRADDPADPWSGQMGLPGGHEELSDEDSLATAIRETAEETGIELDPASMLGRLDDLRPRWKGLPRIVIRPFVFGLARKPAVRAGPEVAGIVWAGLRDLRESESVRDAHPSYLAGRNVVWGITHRILKSFLARVS